MEQFETNEEFIHTLIIEDLDGSISETDKVLLDNWRNADQENEKTYTDFRDIQLGLDLLYAQPFSDADASWDKLEGKIDNQPAIFVAARGNFRLWTSVAAAVVVLLSVGYFFFAQENYTVISTKADAKITHVLLPDGTDLKLNASTTVKYLKDDFNTDRKLELVSGEVFINVTNHDIPAPFRVQIGEVEAQDIGTSFNIARTNSQIDVVVEEGQVAMKHKSSGKEVMLHAGKLGVFDLEAKALNTFDNTNINYKAWVDRKFTFTEAPMSEVVSQLSPVYKSSIRIESNTLKDRKLTARLHYQTLDSVLAVISASLQCKITREKDAYVLSEK